MVLKFQLTYIDILTEEFEDLVLEMTRVAEGCKPKKTLATKIARQN